MATSVLLVEDDSNIQQIFRFMIRAANYKIAGIVARGDRVLEACRSLKPDVIVLDFQLPAIDGLAVLTQLRAAGFHVPVLMYSGFHDDTRVVQCLRAGAQGFLLKTADRETIIEALEYVRTGDGFFVDEAIRVRLHHLCEMALVT